MFSTMVRKKLKIKTASDESTTASVVALPTPTAPSRARQSFVATDENDQEREAECFRQAHDDVAHLRPAHHVRDVVGAVDIEQEDRDEISRDNSEADAFRHQQRHRNHHRQRPRNDQIIDRMDGESAQRVDLLRHFHRPNFRRHRGADAARDHQAR